VLQQQDSNQLELPASPLMHPVKPALQSRARPWHGKGSGRGTARHTFRVDTSQLVQAAKELVGSTREAQAAEAAALLHAAAASLFAGQLPPPGAGAQISMRQLLAAGTPLNEQQMRRLMQEEEAALALQLQAASEARAYAEASLSCVTPHHASLGPASSLRFTPCEGVPERRLAPAAAAGAASAQPGRRPGGSLAYTPMEGVPELRQGFARTPAAPRFAFTPLEGVPEKMSLGMTPHVPAMRLLEGAQQAGASSSGAHAAGAAAGSRDGTQPSVLQPDIPQEQEVGGCSLLLCLLCTTGPVWVPVKPRNRCPWLQAQHDDDDDGGDYGGGYDDDVGDEQLPGSQQDLPAGEAQQATSMVQGE